MPRPNSVQPMFTAPAEVAGQGNGRDAFPYEARAAVIDQRKKLLADLMRQSAQPLQMPEGQMVGRYYVKPSPLAYAVPGIERALTQQRGEQTQRDLERDQREYTNADQADAAAHIASRPQAHGEMQGPRAQGGSPDLDGYSPTTQDKLEWAQQGQRIPSRRDVMTRVMADLEVNEPTREDARAQRNLDREDRQAESRATSESNLALKRDQLEQRREEAHLRSEDARLSFEQRREANRESNQARRDIAALVADPRRSTATNSGQGKTLPQIVIKDLGGLEETVGRVSTLKSEFKPEFGGLKGAALTLAGNNIPGVTTGASEWWRNYAKEAALVERHAMFGASLTDGEKKAWKDADISPSLAPEAIQRNLARREALARKVFSNAVNRHQRAGYNARDAFGMSDDPADPSPAYPPNQLPPSGGTPRRRTVGGKSYVYDGRTWSEE